MSALGIGPLAKTGSLLTKLRKPLVVTFAEV
jgi:hypothetical protein